MAQTSIKQRSREPRANDASPAAEYLNTQQAAAYVGLSAEFLEIARCRRSDGPAWHKLSRAVRYRRSDLDAWMASHRRGGGE